MSEKSPPGGVKVAHVLPDPRWPVRRAQSLPPRGSRAQVRSARTIGQSDLHVWATFRSALDRPVRVGQSPLQVGNVFGALSKEWMGRRSLFEFIVLCPTGSPDAAVPIAGSRAGALGVVSLELAADLDAGLAQLHRLCARTRAVRRARRRGGAPSRRRRCGARRPRHGPARQRARRAARPAGRDRARRPGCGLRGGDPARAGPRGRQAGADAVIAKGHEAGGWIGEEGSFVLSQRLLGGARHARVRPRRHRVHTVAAAYVSGAAGAVLDASSCWPASRPCPTALRAALAGDRRQRDGDVSGRSSARPSRLQPAGPARPRLLRDARAGARGEPRAPSGLARGRQGARRRRARRRGVLPARAGRRLRGRSGAAVRHRRRIIGGLRAAIADACETLEQRQPARGGGAVAESHGTRYPIVQGPMTRVSDRAEFAVAVAEGGALPFLALALMRGTRRRRPAGAHRRAARRAAVGRGRARLRSRGAAQRAARGRARAPARRSR